MSKDGKSRTSGALYLKRNGDLEATLVGPETWVFDGTPDDTLREFWERREAEG
jgi:hypothetical protein